MTRIPPKRREAVLRGAGGKCQRCGSRENLTIDHVLPLSRGGSNRKNLQVLCKNCNLRKGSRVADYRHGAR